MLKGGGESEKKNMKPSMFKPACVNAFNLVPN